MPRNLSHLLTTLGATLLAGFLVASNMGGCGEDPYYSSDCIGADGYNWCLAGSWSGDEIHSPSVEPWDFTSDW